MAVSPTPAHVPVIFVVEVSFAAATEYVTVLDSKVGLRAKPLLRAIPVSRFSVAAALVTVIV